MKRFIRQFPPLERQIRRLRESHLQRRMTHGRTRLNVLDTFPAFVPNSSGSYIARAPLTVQCVNELMPAFVRLAEASRELLKVESLESFTGVTRQSEDTERLAALFDTHGSDKASAHLYHAVYSRLLGDPRQVTRIFEIGLGTHHRDVVSSMGRHGKPGASLRAFRDYCPQAKVFGADIDRRILFEEARIETFYIDQTDPGTFESVGESIGRDFDLMIDDGLHSPHANLNTLKFFLPRLKPGGWAVIEDIPPRTEEIWKLVSCLLPNPLRCHLVNCRWGMMFLVHRPEG